MTNDTNQIAELKDAILDIKRMARKSGDPGVCSWTLLDLISDRALTALGETETQSGKKCLPADPDNLNDERAEWAGTALRVFMRKTGTEREDALGDLLCDLMHWSDRNNFDFDAALCRAQMHYEAETTPEASEAEE